MFKYRQLTKLNVGDYLLRQAIESYQKKKYLLKIFFCMRSYFLRISNYLLINSYIQNSKPTHCRSTKNLCFVTLRARGVYKTFNMSRFVFHQKARFGLLLGVNKSSW